ncbi:helix-turn-helix domain-containing protein [bacterium]|nr:helix-turn-helix domain-containing protein [bacterium]
MTQRIPIEVFPPGDFIREEIEARGWTQEVLAEVLGVSPRLVNEVIVGKRRVTPETARALGEAFGTSGVLWMNLESTYRLSRTEDVDDAVARRSRLYDEYPLKDMIKRGWVEKSSDIDALEEGVLSFFGISELGETPATFAHAARKSTSYEAPTMAQCAWLLRARALATSASATNYTASRFEKSLERLQALLQDVGQLAEVPKVLADGGVRLVLVEQLPGTRIDGAAFWVNAKSPVIALSLRFNRVDCFWHTLLHDAMHILKEDVKPKDEPLLDIGLLGKHGVGTARPPEEERADSEAASFLVPQDKLDAFVASVRPRYSKKKIRAFAETLGVHPGIVVGQLQHRGEIDFSHSRDMLVKVCDVICDATVTDGWGYRPQLND